MRRPTAFRPARIWSTNRWLTTTVLAPTPVSCGAKPRPARTGVWNTSKKSRSTAVVVTKSSLPRHRLARSRVVEFDHASARRHQREPLGQGHACDSGFRGNSLLQLSSGRFVAPQKGLVDRTCRSPPSGRHGPSRVAPQGTLRPGRPLLRTRCLRPGAATTYATAVKRTVAAIWATITPVQIPPIRMPPAPALA